MQTNRAYCLSEISTARPPTARRLPLALLFAAGLLSALLALLGRAGFAQAGAFVAARPAAATERAGLAATKPTAWADLKVVARTGNLGLQNLEKQVSLNDKGRVAFIGNFGDGVGQGLFASNEAGASPRNITPGFKNPQRSFGPGIQINNSNMIVARDWVSGADTIYCLRRWNADSTDSYVIVADGGPGGIGCGDLSTDHAAIYGWPAMNAAGQIAYLALHKTDPLNLLVTDADPDNWLSYKGLSLRPFMADNGSIVVRHTSDATNPTYKLWLTNYSLAAPQALATTSSGFSVLGRSPGISDDGRIIAFYGQDAAGPGIFAAFKTPPGTWAVRRVVSLSDGPEAAFNRFEPDTRVAVNDAGVFAYVAYDQAGNKGVFTNKVNFFSTDAADPYRYKANAAAIPIAVASTSAGAIQDVDLYDPINRNGILAFWAQTAGGEAVIRAEQLARASDYSDPNRHGAYINQYSAGPALNLPVSSPTAGSTSGGDACGPSSFVMLMNAINYARNDGTRLDLKDVYSATMTLSWLKDKQGKPILDEKGKPKWIRSFDWEKGRKYAIKLGYKNATVITGKAAIDAQLAQGIPVLTSTRFSSRAAPALGGGHVILFLGRTANGDYIVSDPAGDYFSSPTAHYGAWKNGEYRIYPEAEVATRLLSDDGKSGRPALALLPIRSSPVTAAAAADETLLVIGHSKVGARPFDLWIQNSAGQMTGFLPDGRQVEEIPGSSAVIDPMLPSDPDAPPEAELDPAVWPYAVSVDAPDAGTRILIHGDQASDYFLEVVRYRADRVINQVLTGSVAAGETLEFDVSQAPPATLDVYPGSLTPVAAIGSAEPLSYTIYIRNNGEGGLTWNASADQSWLHLAAASDAAPHNLGLTVDPNSLPAGQYTGTITLTAPGALNSPTSVLVALTVIGATGADLAVTKSAAPNPATVGKNLTYTLAVVNNGPAPATGVTLTDTLPASVTLITAASSQGSCSSAAPVICQLGSLTAGASATATLVVVPTATGSIVNGASVTGNETDPNPLNNVVTQTMTVEPPANLWIVTKTADTADGACDADCSLREAIIAANASPGADIITVPAGTYALALGTLDVTGPTAINGAGPGLSVIDGGATGFSILSINGQEGAPITVTLAGLTFQRGDGGIKANYVDLVVSQSQVVSNTASYSDGGGINISSGSLVVQSSVVALNLANAQGAYWGASGGGIAASGASVNIRNSQLMSNTAASSGGGVIVFSGALTVLTSTISGNTVLGSGGGVFAGAAWNEEPTSLHVQNSTIANNIAGSGGGGIQAYAESLILQDSTITGNTGGGGGGVQANVNGRAAVVNSVVSYNTANKGYAGMGGGGLALTTQAGLEIADSTIEYNAVTDSRNGGGLYLESRAGEGAPAAAAVTIRDSRFAHNSAGSGGGLYIDTAIPVTLMRTTIVGNQAVREDNPPTGGGIEVYGAGSLALVDSTISDNVTHRHTVTPSGCAPGNGGGVNASAPLFITRTLISNNRAVVDAVACGSTSGGGVNAFSGTDTPVVVADSLFISNTAETGGGLYAGSATLRNTAFLSNTATTGSGGGIYSAWDSTAVSVTLQGNTSGSDGGGAYHGTLAISQSLVKDNTAGGNGGGLSGGGQVVSSTITGNRAANGGGLSVGMIEIVASTISANAAITDGGGIYVPNAYRGGPVVTVRNSTLSGNSASRAGGAFSDRGGWSVSGRFISRAHFHSTSIIGNTAPASSGGGLYHTGHYGDEEGPQVLTLEDTLLADNTGGNCGGAISAEGFVSQGHNLSSDGNCPALTGPGDLKKITAKAGPLADNGGPTFTHALLDGSPAIDAGGANCPAADQRGISRPQGAACDIGAFEWQPTTPYLHVAPANLTFVAVAGALPPPGQPFTVTNTGLAALAWTATEATPWLAVSPGSGAAPASPQVTINQAGLPTGVYTGTITIAAAGAGASPQTVDVTLRVIRVADVIGNWDFEQGRVAWAEDSTTLWNLIRPAAELPAPIMPHSGNWAALLGVNDGEVSDLSQQIALPAGVSLTLSFFYYAISPETDCTYDTVEVRLDGEVVDQIGLCQANNTGGWRQRTVDLGQFPAARLPILHFRAANDPSSDPSTFALDDVRLGTPPPVYDHTLYLPAIVRQGLK